MNGLNFVSIDLTKSVFQICQFADNNKVLSNKQVSRKKLRQEMIQLSPTIIAMEACYSTHYWGRTFEQYGHTVKLVPAQHVKPFVRGNKNDAYDTVAIAEASLRPNMKFVPVKTVEQQDIQSLHRIRDRFVSHRTSISNQTRGLRREYGLVASSVFSAFKVLIHKALESEALTTLFKEELGSIYKEFLDLDERLKRVNNKLKVLAS